MSTARNTMLFAAALAMTTGAVALDHASNGVSDPVSAALPGDAPVGAAPCAIGAAPCAAGSPSGASAPCTAGAPQALAAPPPPPMQRDEQPALAPPPPPPLQRP